MSSPMLPIASSAHVRAALTSLARRHATSIGWVVVLFGVSAVAGLVPAWLIGRLIDRIGDGADLTEVLIMGVAMLASVAVQAACVLLATRKSLLLGERVFAQLREEFMADALSLPIGVVEAAGTGDLVNRTTHDVWSVSSTVRDALPQSLIAVVTIALTVIAGFLVSPIIAPVFLLAAPVLIVVLRWYLRRATPVYLAEGAAFGPIFEAASETIEGARTIDALGLAPHRDRATDEALEGYWRVTIPVIRLQLVLLPWTNLAFALPVIAALAWGGWLSTQGLVSVGAVATLTLFATQLVSPLETLVRWIDELQHGVVSFARVLGVGEVAPADLPDAPEPQSRSVELHDARFAYREGHMVLHGVSLATAEGERLAVVGPSGAGKSTIARLLAGLDAPQSGRATVGGVDIAALSRDRRRGEVLLVTQESHIFAASICDNVRLGDADATDDDVRVALGEIGLGDWVDRLEEGIHTDIGAGGLALSGAQEQQLALARVVLADPHTVILDEATSLLDPTTARALERSVAAVLEGRTVIAIAHRLHTAYDADRIAVVDAGRIVEVGSHDELLATGGAYAELWHAWHGDGTRMSEHEASMGFPQPGAREAD